ncbi:hypothetical protein MHYP_G00134200 [Metynnis hypsauchen]
MALYQAFLLVLIWVSLSVRLIDNEAQSQKDILTLKNPTDHGIITTNCGDMEKIRNHTLNELCVASQNVPPCSLGTPSTCRPKREDARPVLFQLAEREIEAVLRDFENKMASAAASSFFLEKSYRLPDDQVAIVENERFHSPETLFN